MTRTVLSGLLATLCLCSLTAHAQTQAEVSRGQTLYAKWCLQCHGGNAKTALPGTIDAPYPGTLALSLKYQGQVPAMLAERTDLAPVYVRHVVRNGLYGMPRTRLTELSEPELDDVIAYLTRSRP